MHPPTYADLVAAAPLVRRHLRPTPLIEWPALSRLLGLRYLVKHENHNPTTAFKVRGGVHLVGKLTDAQKQAGALGCTTGNHGQSLAYACRLFGVPCTLVVPVNANPDKVAAMQSLGADIVSRGRDFDEAREHCEAVCHERGLRYVHSANEPHLTAGVGTCGLEVFEVCPDADVVLVPVGLGSGSCGMALAGSGRGPGTRIIGVQSDGAPAVTLSWRQGTEVELPSLTTFAEGVATR